MSRTFALTVLAALTISPLAVARQSTDSGSTPSDKAAQTQSSGEAQAATVEEHIDVLAKEWVPENVTTFSRFPFPERLVPASVSSVGATLLEQEDARYLSRALENVAGVTMHKDISTIETFFLRGFDSVTSGLLLTDGAWEPRTGHSLMYNVDRVEVVRGPLSFLYGGNALAGAVNLVRKEPRNEDFFHADLLYGSYSSALGSLDFNHAFDGGKSLFRLNGTYERSDEYRDDGGRKVWGINPSFSTRLGDRTTLTLNLEYNDQQIATDGGIPLVNGEFPDVPRTRSYSYPGNDSDLDTTRIHLDLESALSSTWLLRNKLSYNDQNWLTEGTANVGAIPTFLLIPGAPLDAISVLRLWTKLDQSSTVWGNQTDLQTTLETGRVKHDLVLGLELQQLEVLGVLDVAALAPIDLRNPVELPIPPIPLPQLGIVNDIKTTTVGPYALDNMHIGEQFHVTAGGRVDILTQKNYAIGLDKDYNEFSPFVGVLWAPSGALSLFANYNEGFSPNIALLTLSDPKPERSAQVEAGVKGSGLGGRLRGSVSVYELKKKNLAIADRTGFTAQLGDQRSRGVEAEVNATVGAGTSFLLAYSYTDAELTRFTVVDPLTGQIEDLSGNTPSWVPKTVFSSWVNQALPAGFTVAGGVRWVGERFVNDQNSATVDSDYRLDAAVRWERGRYHVTLNLNNLTDEHSYSRVVGFDAVRPEPGFNASVGLRFRLH